MERTKVLRVTKKGRRRRKEKKGDCPFVHVQHVLYGYD